MVPDWPWCRNADDGLRKLTTCRHADAWLTFLWHSDTGIYFNIIWHQHVIYGQAGCIAFHYLQFKCAEGIAFHRKQYGRAGCIHFHCQQYGRAGWIPFHRQKYGRAGCIPFHCQQYVCAGCIPFHHQQYGRAVGSSDFPRSLCFMWFWFGLEILKLVYKKVFFKILIGFYLIWAFNFQKNSTVPNKSWKKISSKLGVQGIKRSGILRWFQICVELLRNEVPKDFFSEKQFFAKFSKSLKIQFFCKTFFPFCQTRDFCTFFKSAQNSASFDTLHAQFWRNFFSTLIRGSVTFSKDKRSNKIETVQYFKKHFFINNS